MSADVAETIETSYQSEQTSIAVVGVPETSSRQFEAQLPDFTALGGFVFTGMLLYAASKVWWVDVVPIKRTELAQSKKDGPVRDYLDSLGSSASSLRASRISSPEEWDLSFVTSPPGVPSRAFERWLFSDWLATRAERRAAGPKEAALPFLKKAKWNSGDNPVLVAFAAVLASVITASAAERVSMPF
jgi:hypothetical protein